MAKKGSLKHIHVEPNTDGSAQIKAHHAMPSGEKMPMDYGSNDESASGSTPEEAGAHVTRMLKQHFGKNSDSKYKNHAAAKAFGR